LVISTGTNKLGRLSRENTSLTLSQQRVYLH
jgi:hypothetical protein